jgi:phosphatidylethanolamine-binding protein (PEBP) family uncharacterized protein
MTPSGSTHVPLRRALPLKAIFVSTLTTLLLVLAGCGGSNKTSTTSAGRPVISTASTAGSTSTTTTTSKQTTTANTPQGLPLNERVQLASTAIPPGGAIPARYTCDGQDTPPPLSWETPPSGTVELMLDIIKVKPVNGELYFAWAITGIKPNVHRLSPPKLPAGVIVGTNSNGQVGYHFCQPKGSKETYVAALFALPRHLPAKQGFNATQMRLEAENTANYQSLYIFNYTRH